MPKVERQQGPTPAPCLGCLISSGHRFGGVGGCVSLKSHFFGGSWEEERIRNGSEPSLLSLGC